MRELPTALNENRDWHSASIPSSSDLSRDRSDHESKLPHVLIYADPLLAPSVTFVRSQGEALHRFIPFYAGARAFRGPGLILPEDRTILINKTGSTFGKIKEVPFKIFGFDPIFLRRVRNVQPTLIHAHGGPNALTALPLARHLHVPLIATFHGSDVTVAPTRAHDAHYTAKSYWKRAAVLRKEARLCIAVSKFVHDKLLEQAYSPQRTILHYIGIDTHFFKSSCTHKREPIVLFVGTLHEVKGCEYLVRAMVRVQAVVRDVRLVVIGDGPLRSQLEIIARQQIRDFTFLGTQPPEVVRSWMDRARVFCVPSVTAASGATEAFGLVFLEAQAMGLPVASFSSGGIPEAVLHGKTGLLSPERDFVHLSAHLIELLGNDGLWCRMSEYGRKRVETSFDLSKQTRVLEELYERILAPEELRG
ncbi:MAG TPA: glycosyltransferase [Terriglobales bacterium]|nr:glycosyltransferase [Terriglobales bacterium]